MSKASGGSSPTAAHRALRGDLTRATLDALRDAPGPMTTKELARHVMAERGLNFGRYSAVAAFHPAHRGAAPLAEEARHPAVGQGRETRPVRPLGDCSLVFTLLSGSTIVKEQLYKLYHLPNRTFHLLKLPSQQPYAALHDSR